MSMDLYLRNGLIVTEESTFRGGVVVHQGKIEQLVLGDPTVEAKQVIDLDGHLVLPGVVDDHVHFNEPGREHWEGYRTGSMAAVAGGVTTILEMPLNATPPTISRELLTKKRAVAARESVVDYGQWGGLVNNNLDALDDMNADGVIGFKAFLSNSAVDFERIDDDLLFAGLGKMRTFGNVLGLHAENEWVTRFLGDRMRGEGRTDRASWHESRPPESELEAIQRSLFWAKQSGGNLHIVHVSIASGIRSVVRERLAGSHVTAETCPHFLFFDHDDFVRIGPDAKCAPPIRSRADVEDLWQCVLSGQVDTIASDHSPCTTEEKERGNDNIWQAWGGITGIQAMLPALLTEGYHKRGLALPALVRMLSGNPARIFGIYPQKGALLPGSDADLVVVDLDREWTLSRDQLLSKNKHSPYVGYRFKGSVEQTIIRGVPVHQRGEILVDPGFGKLVKRKREPNSSK